MAIPCEACAQPVHEQVVVCPHCGERTGVPADPEAALRIAALPAIAADPAPAVESVIEPLISALGAAVDGALGLLGDDAEPELPRAIARERRER